MNSNKLDIAISVIKTFKNWPTYFLTSKTFRDCFTNLDFLYDSKNITYNLHNGIKIKVGVPGDKCIIKEIFIDKTYTPDGFDINKNDIVVDIGAHIGTFAFFAVVNKAKKVYAYEPTLRVYRIMRENIGINSIKNIKTFKVAVAGKKGVKKLFHGEFDYQSFYKSCIPIKNPSLFITVKCITLKDIFDSNNLRKINFLKMDCEGAEYEILFNTPKKYLRKIDKISLEYHSVLKYNIGDLNNFLEKIGFNVTTFEKKSGVGSLYAKQKGE